MRKRNFSLLAATVLIMMVSFPAISAFAATIPEDAYQFNGHSYRYYEAVTTTPEFDGYSKQSYYYLGDGYFKITNNMAETRVFKPKYTWDEAEAFCEQMGGHLVTITSRFETNAVFDCIQKAKKDGNLTLQKYISKDDGEEKRLYSDISYPYIGLQDLNGDAVWEWVTGEKSDYVNFTFYREILTAEGIMDEWRQTDRNYCLTRKKDYEEYHNSWITDPSIFSYPTFPGRKRYAVYSWNYEDGYGDRYTPAPPNEYGVQSGYWDTYSRYVIGNRDEDDDDWAGIQIFHSEYSKSTGFICEWDTVNSSKSGSANNSQKESGSKTIKKATIKASKTSFKKGKKPTVIKITSNTGAKLTVKGKNARAKNKKYVKIKNGKTAKLTFQKKAPKGKYTFTVTSAKKGNYKKTTKSISIRVK